MKLYFISQKCESNYKSIIDALKSFYFFDSLNYRKEIGKVNNITYKDSAEFNIELL